MHLDVNLSFRKILLNRLLVPPKENEPKRHNDPKHWSKSSTEWLWRPKICLWEWRSQSSDLNPIELTEFCKEKWSKFLLVGQHLVALVFRQTNFCREEVGVDGWGLYHRRKWYPIYIHTSNIQKILIKSWITDPDSKSLKHVQGPTQKVQ